MRGSGKSWEQNFDFSRNVGFSDQNMSKRWFFGIFLDFWAPKIEKKGTLGLKIKNLFPTFFQTCFHLGFGRFSAQMDYLGKSY